ncbi:hypothetical protein FNV43_RR08253 [Rhamnella rubrinervis]|uniref:Uncharacterized protein n=1 Tax=Rhamnella rubrinervis TaxID=2594499 RepID=A0A8K0HGV6_9ROSA|nr:hypothetical protein FNV43_RR08253 [Rhamnella rubrinervis]
MSKPKDLSKVGPGPEKQSNRLALAMVSKEHHVDARVGSSVSLVKSSSSTTSSSSLSVVPTGNPNTATSHGKQPAPFSES